MATTLIDKKTAEFEISRFKDNYTSALRELVERKTKAKSAKRVTAGDEEEPVSTGDNVIDLMDALKKSLEKTPGGKSGTRKKKQTKKKSSGRKSSKKRKRA